MWYRSLIDVPTDTLWPDPHVSRESPKGYSGRDLQEIMATVPFVYELIHRGWGDREFERAQSSSSARERALSETYNRLWKRELLSESLHAHMENEILVVDSGNHRVSAAQSIGIPVLPVWIHSKSAEELERIRLACVERNRQMGFGGPQRDETGVDRGRATPTPVVLRSKYLENLVERESQPGYELEHVQTGESLNRALLRTSTPEGRVQKNTEREREVGESRHRLR